MSLYLYTALFSKDICGVDAAYTHVEKSRATEMNSNARDPFSWTFLSLTFIILQFLFIPTYDVYFCIIMNTSEGLIFMMSTATRPDLGSCSMIMLCQLLFIKVLSPNRWQHLITLEPSFKKRKLIFLQWRDWHDDVTSGRHRIEWRIHHPAK